MLAVLADAYKEDTLGEEGRSYLKLSPKVAPYVAAVFPLLKNKEALVEKARMVFSLLKKDMRLSGRVTYDEAGTIGKRYRRHDEIGTPYCIAIDFDTLENDTVTIRNRDTGEQERVTISELTERIAKDL
jgi:glycyl-tRNA synthetase